MKKAAGRTRTAGKRLCLMLLPAALLAGLFLCVLFLLPSPYTRVFHAALQDKAALLEGGGDQPRIITLGGSGAAFGQRSDLLEAELPGYRVVNAALYGGLGTAPMLDLVLRDVRKGDIILLSPEQNEQTLGGFFGARAMWQAADGRGDLLFRLSGARLRALWGDALPFAAEKLSFLLRGYAPEGDGVYARDHFTPRGDVADAGRERNTMPGGADPDMPVRFAPDMLSPDFAEQMNAFARACGERGAQVYYRFCPMNRSALSPEEAERAEGYTAFLRETLCFPVLGEAEDSLLDSVWFFDTNFHLNAAGAQVYTARLAAALKEALGLEGPVSIALPEAPAPEEKPREATAGAEEAADAACFLFEERDGEAYVVGLTEEGRSRERLRLPGTLGGRPVTAFAPETFAGNETLRELTLPETLRRIGDGSFRGCAGLEKLILMGEDPSRTAVGPGLLDGTGCRVEVPEKAYSRYATNYFWTVHASRIRPGAAKAEEGAPAETPPAPEGAKETAEAVLTVDANGGEARDGGESRRSFPVSGTHLRTNSPLGQRLFRREGYVPLGWNTKPDGSGESVPFGGRTDSAELYMMWAEAVPEAELTWEEQEGGARITGWSGERRLLAIPEKLGGLPVTRVASGAFAEARIDTAVLPPTLFALERNAFAGSSLREICLYDSLFYVYDESFTDCGELRTLRLNAATSPRYSVSYYAAFADKMDWLRESRKAGKRLVLAGGSATRYAYDSEVLAAAFPDYTPVNMGVFAYCAMLPQYRLMQNLMGEGDVLLSAPEFDTVRTQFCTDNALDDRFWPLTEADLGLVPLLDLSQYSRVFDSLAEYLHTRSMMTARSYEETPKRWDDDGNPSPVPTYNRFGDYTLPRQGAEKDEMLQSFRANYTLNAFPEETVEALNRVYREFEGLGVKVLYAYAPRNHSALTEESTPEKRAELDVYLREKLCVPVVLGMEESLYPATLFYLIDNHLSDEGVRLHMQHLLPGLREALEAPEAQEAR